MKRQLAGPTAGVAALVAAIGGLVLHSAQASAMEVIALQTTVAQLPVVACVATAYLNDPDPKGTNVRSASNAKSASVAIIRDSDSQVEITGASGDWLRIRQVRSVDGTITFKGEGWMFASLVAVRARGAAILRATPDVASAVVVKLHDDDQLSVVGCRGDWLQVKHGTPVGWIGKNSRCGNPVTTCV